MTIVSETPTSSPALAARAAKNLRAYLDGGRVRTDLLRDVAADMVEIRSRCILDDGRVDWSGWSREYRSAASSIYGDAGVPKDDLPKIQNALRYHVQNFIRARAPEHELEAVGLSTTSPKERILRDRDAVAAVAATVGSLDERREPLKLLSYADTLLSYVHADELEEYDAVSRRAVELMAAKIQEHLDRILLGARHP